MSIPSENPVPDNTPGLPARLAVDVFTALARLDERVKVLIDTVREDRREREKADKATSDRLDRFEKRLGDLETERVADKRSLDVWKTIGTIVVGLLAAAIGTEWFGEFFKK